MAKKWFKALVPFSTENGKIYNPGDKKPGRADAERLAGWVKAGIAKELEDYNPNEAKADPKPVNDFEMTATASTDQTEEVEGVPQEPEDEKEQETASMNESEVEGKEEGETDNETEQHYVDTLSYPDLKKAAKAAGIERYNSKKAEVLRAELKEKGE